jgi:succinate-semialdehyde dehydrogenase / glutarate-semialdehyde dehydrogenase
MAEITTVNPATGEDLQTYHCHGPGDIETVVADAVRAAADWKATSFDDRAAVLREVATTLRARSDELARLISMEMGKPLREAAAEIEKCAVTCDHYADNGAKYLQDDVIESSAKTSWVSYEPLGVVLAIMPWNFPFWQVLRFYAPAIIAGNATILKHSPNVTGCALAVEQVLAEAGAPKGLFQTIVVSEDDVPTVIPDLLADPRIAAVTLTGSERAGSAVGAAAGKNIKKAVLELGGSDPFVVLADADLDLTINGAMSSKYANDGQSCIAAKRFIVAADVYDEFVSRLTERVNDLVVGDPLDDATTTGPMAREDLADGVARQVDAAVEEGATVVTGGSRLDRPGAFYAPTILTDVKPGSVVLTEEVFGPVTAVVRVDDDDAAVALANDTPYGLGASVWGDAEHALQVGRRIVSGMLFVNSIVASDPRVPFGGIKRSGLGRELSTVGIREFTNQRTVWVGGDAPQAAATE